MFLGWNPTEFVKICVLPICLTELCVVLCNFRTILKKYSIKPQTEQSPHSVW